MAPASTVVGMGIEVTGTDAATGAPIRKDQSFIRVRAIRPASSMSAGLLGSCASRARKSLAAAMQGAHWRPSQRGRITPTIRQTHFSSQYCGRSGPSAYRSRWPFKMRPPLPTNEKPSSLRHGGVDQREVCAFQAAVNGAGRLAKAGAGMIAAVDHTS